MERNNYTREEVLKLIEEAFFDGIDAGEEDYAGECFLAEDYLKD